MQDIDTMFNQYKDGIYEVTEIDTVYGKKTERGQTVKVVKGRKFPIGAEYVINGFWTDQWGHTFAYMKTGEKINIDNIVLSEPIVERKKIDFAYHKGEGCPHCHSHNIVCLGESFDPLWDRYKNNNSCEECGAKSSCYI